jgi:uncharacterized protein YecT (DUF1311 family)
VVVRLAVIACVAALVVSGAGLARAASGPSLGACLKPAQSTADMDGCIGTASAKAQRELAAAYATLRARKGFDASDRAALAAAQNRWLAFRAADCGFAESLHKGGTLAGVDHGLCLVRDTTERTAALRAYSSTR